MKKILFILLVTGTIGAIAQQNDALLKACSIGNLAEVKSLVEKGADVNYSGATGTPVSVALF